MAVLQNILETSQLPILSAFLLGIVFALAIIMSVIALSLPEITILKNVLKWQLITAFVGIVATGIIIEDLFSITQCKL